MPSPINEDGDLPKVLIVGVGPAGPEYLTEKARSVLDDARVVLCRTAQHPVLEMLIGVS
jgi:precorrin-6B methylase 1